MADGAPPRAWGGAGRGQTRRETAGRGAGGAMVREAEARGNETRTAVNRRARWRRVEVTDDEQATQGPDVRRLSNVVPARYLHGP